ncbi:U2 small nuclear ribonucleoprotein B'' [Apostasia shenzhenica]|uniref:U2 small nuclear ribonucleoprotein B n=1 Tax=Apostasia shenzhenica TaxID=1088818 RepID=A0A2I0A3Z1_9ASPA|nr:U2 small nuclear ribonucleoprotein B'' [Apostasia shenzhenica]
MADGYWRYSDPRQQAAMVAPPSAASLKRPRPDYGDIAAAPEMLGYYPREGDRTALPGSRDPGAINASYDRYLQNGISSYGAAEPVRPVVGGLSSHPVDDPRLPVVGYGSGRPEPPLPPDASNTLFVEGLPANCTRREVSHVFRPFVGFQDVRLVNKDSRHPGGDPLVLCFVDFATARQATIALDALQGEHNVPNV